MNEKKWWQTFVIEPENWAGEWWVKADHLPDIIAEAERRERKRIRGIVKSRLAILDTLFASTQGIKQDETASKINELNDLLSKLSNE